MIAAVIVNMSANSLDLSDSADLTDSVSLASDKTEENSVFRS